MANEGSECQKENMGQMNGEGMDSYAREFQRQRAHFCSLLTQSPSKLRNPRGLFTTVVSGDVTDLHKVTVLLLSTVPPSPLQRPARLHTRPVHAVSRHAGQRAEAKLSWGSGLAVPRFYLSWETGGPVALLVGWNVPPANTDFSQ